MISAILLATTLIVPPKGMGQVPSIPAEKAGILRREGLTILESFRGIATTKWDNHWYKTPFYIGVARYDRDIDPAYLGMQSISSEANPPLQYQYSYACTRTNGCVKVPYHRRFRVVAAEPITLCNGSRGWINKFREGSLDYTVVQVFARSNGQVYMASTGYDATNGDIFHAEKALKTLCPPGAAPPQTFQPPAQVRAPAGFLAVDTSSVPQMGEELDTRALWLRFMPKTATVHAMIVAQATDVDENVTPEQESDFMRQSFEHGYRTVKTVVSRAQSYCGIKDGWYRTFTAIDPWGYRYNLTTQYAYAGGMSYVVTYTQRADEQSDPAALAALRSFCPR